MLIWFSNNAHAMGLDDNTNNLDGRKLTRILGLYDLQKYV